MWCLVLLLEMRLIDLICNHKNLYIPIYWNLYITFIFHSLFNFHICHTLSEDWSLSRRWFDKNCWLSLLWWTHTLPMKCTAEQKSNLDTTFSGSLCRRPRRIILYTSDKSCCVIWHVAVSLHVDDLRPRSSFSLFPGIRGQVDSNWRHPLHLGVGSQKFVFF